MRYLIVEIPWFVDQIPALQNDRVYKVFQYVFCIEELAGDKVCDQSRDTGDRREDKLSRIETEEYGLGIASYFFVDSYFHFL